MTINIEEFLWGGGGNYKKIENICLIIQTRFIDKEGQLILFKTVSFRTFMPAEMKYFYFK